MEKSFIYTTLLSFLWSFFVALFGIPAIIYVAERKSILDEPGKRSVHQNPIPRLGGLAIFAGFISSLTIFGKFELHEPGFQQILAGSIVIFFIGLKDDISAVSAFKKFFVQLLAAGVLIFKGGLVMNNLHGLLGIHGQIDPGLSYLITFVFIIGFTNALNLIDGINGLSGTIVSYISLFFGVFYIYIGSYYAFIAFALLGGVVGFLRFNIFKAKIFMGDTGSLISGFIISGLMLKFVAVAPQINVSPIVGLGVIVLPIVDTTRVFIIRVIKGVSPFAPDKNHIHHRLIDLGLKHIQAVLLLLFSNIILTVTTFFLSTIFNVNIVVLALITLCLLLCLILEFIHRKKFNEV